MYDTVLKTVQLDAGISYDYISIRKYYLNITKKQNLLSMRENLKKNPKFRFFLFLKNTLFSTHDAFKNNLT